MATLTIRHGTDTTGGYSLGVLSTVDPDADDTFTYTIDGGADAAKFSIGGAGDDELILTDGVLDRESKATYVCNVTTTDAGLLEYTEEFTITVVEGGLITTPAQPPIRSGIHSPAFSPLSVHPALIGGA